MLDKPMFKKPSPSTGPFVWKTVEKGGEKFNVQVRVNNAHLEAEIVRQIDAMPSGDHTAETVIGGLIINLTRRS